MKLSFLSLALLLIISACNGQSGAREEALKVKKAIDDAPRPGTMPTTTGGWTMTAKVDGKAWTAGSIMPPAAAGRIIGYFGKTNYIGLPAFEKRYAKVGGKKDFSKEQGVDMLREGDGGSVYQNSTGSIEITKMNGDWVEGTFHFILSTTDGSKKVTVTDGFFRVQL
jgi:hypothetical protein